VRLDVREFYDPLTRNPFESCVLKTNFNEGIYRAVEWLAILHRGELQGTQGVHMTELRKRLQKAGARFTSSRTPFSNSRKEAGVGELNGSLGGQLAVVTGQKDIFVRGEGGEKFWCGVRPVEGAVWLFEQPAPGTGGDYGPGRSARAGCVARHVVGPVERAGNETGRFAQHAATQLARVIKAKPRKLKPFPSALASADKQTNNNKVNRRFTNELKKTVACRAKAGRRRTTADDETIRKVTWLTLETW